MREAGRFCNLAGALVAAIGRTRSVYAGLSAGRYSAFEKLENERMQAQGFGRKGFPAGSAAAPAPMQRPIAPAVARRDSHAEPNAGFVAHERLNAAEDVNTLAWDTPTSGRSWGKSRLIAYLLWFFAGGVAGHRLYCGRYISAALQAIIGMVGFCVLFLSPYSIGTWVSLLLIQGVWLLFDLVLIPGMCRNPPAAY